MKFQVYLLFLISIFSLSFRASGQDLQPMPVNPDITVGELPNGIKYYIVKNPSTAGLASYSLVQKGGIPVETSREALNSLPHFTEVTPYKFLTRRGVGYKKWGYIDHSRNATFYRFEDLSTADAAVNDSTLMMIFDLCQIYPNEQAVIVSGDVNPASVRDRMSVFSLMVSQRQTLPEEKRTTETLSEPFRVESLCEANATPTHISLKINSARTPSGLMGTIQPHMTQYFVYELGLAMETRLRKAFFNENIPLPQMDFDFRGSLDSDKEDCLTFDIYVSETAISRATTLLGQTIASIDKKGLTEEEYIYIKAKGLIENPCIKADAVMDNDFYLDRCAAAFLDGASLASSAEVRRFFTSKTLDISTETSLFNNFADAFIDPVKNMSLTYESSLEGLNCEALSTMFRSGWKSDEFEDAVSPITAVDPDVLSIPVSKVKLKTESVEPATGGKMWTFSNGIKVIYKKMPGTGHFDYKLLLKGGYASIPDLGNGQGPFVSDMLDICDVAGMSSDDFHRYLDANGISIKTQVNTADMQVSGSAPADKIQMVIEALAAVANKRSDNHTALKYFLESEKLRIMLAQKEEYGYIAMADSVMRPDYKYTPYRYLYGLSEDIQSKSGKFFDSQFAKVNDGYFIFMGDLEEEALQKTLSRFLGNFSCGKADSSKPSAPYMMLAGETSILDEGEENDRMQLNISMSNKSSVSSDRYMAFQIAEMALQKGLARTLGETGMYAEVSGDFEIYPAERLRLTVRCFPCDIDGLPAGINPNAGWRIFREVRRAVKNTCNAPVSEEDLSLYKKQLLASMNKRLNTAEDLSELVVLRYASNRDFITKYADKINAVTAADVQDVLKQISSGCSVEYNIK